MQRPYTATPAAPHRGFVCGQRPLIRRVCRARAAGEARPVRVARPLPARAARTRCAAHTPARVPRRPHPPAPRARTGRPRQPAPVHAARAPRQPAPARPLQRARRKVSLRLLGMCSKADRPRPRPTSIPYPRPTSIPAPDSQDFPKNSSSSSHRSVAALGEFAKLLGSWSISDEVHAESFRSKSVGADPLILSKNASFRFHGTILYREIVPWIPCRAVEPWLPFGPSWKLM